jgi:hypothetical protein
VTNPQLRVFNWGEVLLAPIFCAGGVVVSPSPAAVWTRVLTEPEWAPVRGVLPKWSNLRWADLQVPSPSRTALVLQALGADIPPLVRAFSKVWTGPQEPKAPPPSSCVHFNRCSAWDQTACVLKGPARKKGAGLPGCYQPPPPSLVPPDSPGWQGSDPARAEGLDALLFLEMVKVWDAGGWVLLVSE